MASLRNCSPHSTWSPIASLNAWATLALRSLVAALVVDTGCDGATSMSSRSA